MSGGLKGHIHRTLNVIWGCACCSCEGSAPLMTSMVVVSRDASAPRQASPSETFVRALLCSPTLFSIIVQLWLVSNAAEVQIELFESRPLDSVQISMLIRSSFTSIGCENIPSTSHLSLWATTSRDNYATSLVSTHLGAVIHTEINPCSTRVPTVESDNVD